jgi:rubrerythrin
MATKPTYVGLLNAIANGERGGHQLFSSWSAATKNKELKKTLDVIAIREMEHSWAFEKRLSELGFDLRPPADESGRQALAKQVELLSSKASETEKFASFGLVKQSKAKDAQKAEKKSAKKSDKKSAKKADRKSADDEPDKLLKILADPNIDPTTGALMGRFIAEERDTGRLLRRAFKACQQRSKK